MTTGPDEWVKGAVAGRGRFRAAHADRDHVIELLKAAFVRGQLDKGEFDARVSRALTARTYADLAALTADVPAVPEPATPHRPHPRTLARATRRSGLCMLVALPLWLAGAGVDYFPAILIAFVFVMAASGFFGYGVVDTWSERRSRSGVPPRKGRPRRDLEGGRPARTGRDPASPATRADRAHGTQGAHGVQRIHGVQGIHGAHGVQAELRARLVRPTPSAAAGLLPA